MSGFRSTLLWVLGSVLLVYVGLTISGVVFIKSHNNAIATTIVDEHLGSVASIYGRIGIGYLLAGFFAALALHPFVRRWKAALAVFGLMAIGLLYTLTSDTLLLHGPTQTMFCTVHDAIPAGIRDLYSPVQIEIAFGVLALVALWAWTKRITWRIKTPVVAVVGGVAIVGMFPSVSAATTERTCVLLIATDSLRADHLSCNGYERETTPHIDALAAQGTNFENCLVPTASTHESWVTIMSSREPRDHGMRHMFPSRGRVRKLESDNTFLPEVLRDDGYQTAVIGGWCGTTFSLIDMGVEHVDVSNSQNHLGLIAEAAFTNHLLAAAFLDNPVGRFLLPELERTSFTRGSSALTSKAKRWLQKAAKSDEPFFLTVVYHVTHLPYSASYPYYTMYTDPEYRGRNRYRIDFKIDDMIQRGFDHDLSPEETQHIKDLYDGCVTEFDDQVGALVAALKELGLADRTVVGVLGDHGDDLYEHGTTLGHGVTLFGGDQANRIPAVFAGPGVQKRRVPGIVRSWDLAPTMLRWLDIDKRPAKWKGVDLSGDIPELDAILETSYLLYRQPVPDLEPGEVVKDFPRFDQATFLDPDFDFNLVLREELNDRVVETKCLAVREGKWKLIMVPGENGPIYRLFDLSADPQCRRDVRRAEPETFARLKEKLAR